LALGLRDVGFNRAEIAHTSATRYQGVERRTVVQELTPKQRRLLSALLAGAAVACGLLVATWIHMPTPAELSVTSQRAGLYIHTSAAVRSYASSSLDGIALYCSASIAGAGAACGFANAGAQISGTHLSVDETRVKTLWGSVQVVVRATRNGTVIYSNGPEQLREYWLNLSLWYVFLGGAISVFAWFKFSRD
jgi:hypothetical protein